MICTRRRAEATWALSHSELACIGGERALTLAKVMLEMLKDVLLEDGRICSV